MDCSKEVYFTNKTTTENASLAIHESTRIFDSSENPLIFQRIYGSNQSLPYLLHFNVSHCDLTEIRQDFLKSMVNLRVFDISYNKIKRIQSNMFISQKNLIKLHLVGNLEMLVIEQEAFAGLNSIRELSLSDLNIDILAKYAFSYLELDELGLSFCTIKKIESFAFGRLKAMNVYLNSSSIMYFDKGMFNGLEIDHTIITDEYKFCCIRPSLLPEESCYPHKDEFSSCSDLMENVALRSLIWVIGFFALIGNGATFIYRITKDKARLKLGYGIFVTNLAASDFMMGVYLIIIAGADAYYRGVYVFEAEAWRQGLLCQLAGILASLSSESEVLFIILITIDRILVIKFPFGQVKFMRKSALIASVFVWAISLLIAIFPVTYTPYFKGQFYSKTGVCLALPLTSDKPPGWIYAIAIFIGFNSITFVLIAVGQVLIHMEIKKQRKKMAKAKTERSNDLTISRNLLLVVATDFLCWFPIGILGMLALCGQVIPAVVYAWTAVFVLPINSALNPFLYTLTAIISKKKFSPDVNEQARPQVYLKADVDKIIEAWKSKHVTLTTEPKNLCRLNDVLNDKTTTRRQYIKILYGVLKYIDILHQRNMVQDDLTTNDIYVYKQRKSRAILTFTCRPKLSAKAAEKANNMGMFWSLLATVLLKCSNDSRKKDQDQTSAKPFASTGNFDNVG